MIIPLSHDSWRQSRLERAATLDEDGVIVGTSGWAWPLTTNEGSQTSYTPSRDLTVDPENDSQCSGQHFYVIGGRIRTSITGSQKSGERLPAGTVAVVAERQQRVQRVQPRTLLIGRGGQLLVGVCGDQRGVDIDDEQGRRTQRRPARGYRTVGCRRRRPPVPSASVPGRDRVLRSGPPPRRCPR